MNTAADKLDAATERLNKAIVSVENRIHGAGYTVAASVPIPAMLGLPESMLLWKKHGTTWGLYVPNGDELVPLRSAARSLRARAVGVFAALFKALDDETERQFNIINEAAEEAEKWGAR